MGSVNINDVLSKQEVKALTQRSDLRAGFLVLVDWAIVAGVFATCAYWTNPLTNNVSLAYVAQHWRPATMTP